jgi:hypothetical protein
MLVYYRLACIIDFLIDTILIDSLLNRNTKKRHKTRVTRSCRAQVKAWVARRRKAGVRESETGENRKARVASSIKGGIKGGVKNSAQAPGEKKRRPEDRTPFSRRKPRVKAFVYKP